MDVIALAADDTVKTEDVGSAADFLHRRPAQVASQLGMTGRNHRKPAAGIIDHLHQPLKTEERVTVQIVLVDEQRYRSLAFFHQLLQLALAPFSLLGNLHLPVLRQVIVKRRNPGGDLDAVLFHQH
ncbi:MAG: hypothetical protein ACI9ZF_003140 [Bradyrhizobium sp.]|jgi:hypothetical protein